jgi:hypothetical protein
MATFTRIADDERPSISVDPSAIISKIEDNIYGGFTEYAQPHLQLDHTLTYIDTWVAASMVASMTPETPCPMRTVSERMLLRPSRSLTVLL